MDELSVKCVLYSDGQIIFAPSACGLQEMVNKMNDSVKKMGMKVNVGKTRVMVFEKGESKIERDVLIEGEKVEQESECGKQTNRALFAIMTSKSVSRQARLAVHSGVLIPTLMYGSESWIWQKKSEIKINRVEMRSLRSMCGVSRKDRCRNSDIRDWYGLKEDVVTRVERYMLR
ncbi:hypothetical protein EVAR_76911_1 [Eumeta japonica]|uniref:Reverse transcriptase domain-containing protein n=1 Tax=Eumeta variegata TaxID=151549 RepID=A0A4C1SEQ4_EUMVA|nr:hypothetical protein EVAR_76911_1 [Eumeta japonica]